MAITFVGFQEGGRTGNTTTQTQTYALTGGLAATPAAGDLVVVALCVSTQGRTQTPRIIDPPTWLGLTTLVADGTYDCRFNVSYKFMEETPDTNFVTQQSGHIDDAQQWTVHVYRGVDPVTPLDVTPTSATGTGTGWGNPPPITPVTPGACLVVATANANTVCANQSNPGGLTGFIQGTMADVNDAGVATGHVLGWTSGEVNIAFYTTGTTDATASWASYVLALRPAAAGAAGGLLILGP